MKTGKNTTISAIRVNSLARSGKIAKIKHPVTKVAQKHCHNSQEQDAHENDYAHNSDVSARINRIAQRSDRPG
jgi:hypothetical protein